MNIFKNKKTIALLSIFFIAIMITSCTMSAKDKAIKEIKGVDLKAYMQEDQKDLKEFKEAYIKDMEKVRTIKEAEKLLKQFKEDLKTFATKKDKVKTYKELVIKEAGDKKAEAEKVLKDYDKKLNDVKSNKELDKLTKEINEKLTEKTGSAISVTTSEVETSTPAAKAYTKQASSGRSTSGHTKQRVWVVDKEAWTETVTKYRTETQQYTVYRCSDGAEFPDYASAYEYYCYVGENGDPVNFGAVTKTRTVQVPYTETINHPEEGHWEYR